MCGETKIHTLSFHHMGDKTNNLANMSDMRMSLIEKEINKCICVCENCHREIHDKDSTEVRRKQNKNIMLEFKNIFKCEKCGYDKCNRALDFHHLDEKTLEFSRFANGKRWKTVGDMEDDIKKELESATVLCSNCHREEHFDIVKFKHCEDRIKDKINNIKENNHPFDAKIVCDMFDSGITPSKISKKLKTSRGTICGILKKFNRTETQKIIDIEEVKRLHENGLYFGQIKKQMKCHRGSLWLIFKKLGVKSNKTKKEYVKRKEIHEVIKLRNSGKSLREISKIYDVSYVTIGNWIKEYERHNKL